MGEYAERGAQMSNLKDKAIDRLNDLVRNKEMNSDDYGILFDAICEIDPLKDRDEQLEALWDDFGNVPYNEETETIEEDFLTFRAGTHRYDIWKWFDERHSKGVAYLLYKYGRNRCYVLRSNNYADGDGFEVFFYEDAAKAAMEIEVESVVENLKSEGYTPKTINKPYRPEVYVPDTGIYYDWEIFPTDISTTK